MSDLGRFEAVLLCEDVRREDSGKMFAVGIYVGDIIPYSYPANILLKLYLHYFAPVLGTRELNFILELDQVEAARIEGSIRQDSLNTPIALNLPAVSLAVEKPGQLDVYAVTGDERELIISRRILPAA